MGMDDPALDDVRDASGKDDLVVVAGPALSREAGIPLAGDLLTLLLDRARRSKGWEEAIAELGELAGIAEAAGDRAALRDHLTAARAVLARMDREGKGKGDAQVAKIRAILDAQPR